MNSYRRIWLAVAAFGLGLLAVTADVHAQQAGTIRGRVIDAQTQQPLPGVQISISGSQRGTMTGQDGTFLIPGIQTGTREVRAQYIGFSSQSINVQVVAGETVEATFELRQSVLDMEEIVVTGIAGQSTRAKLPFAVERVTAAQMPIPATNAGNMLQARTAGMQVTATSGRPGSAPSVLLRGPTSINATGRSQEPLYIVDGVILSASIVDVDAMDIESIEIVKGAAAASLYGSRAANGVIQITTNRGQNVANDQVRYTFRTEAGRSELPGRFNLTQSHHYALTPSGQFISNAGVPCDFTACPSLLLAGQRALPGEAASFWNTTQSERWPGQTYDQIDRFFRDGDFMTNYFSVAGRSGGTNYLISYNRIDEQGILPGAAGLERHNFRLNVDQSVRNNLTVSASASYSRSAADPREGTIFQLTRMPAGVDLLSEDPRFPGTGQIILKPDPSQDNQNPLQAMLNQTDLITRGRYIASVNAAWNPMDWFRLDGLVAFDRLDYNRELFSPKGYRTLSNPNGTGGSLQRINDLQENMNASITAQFRRTFGDLNTTSSVRYLIEREDYTRTNTSGTDFTADEVWTFSNIPNANINATSVIQPERADGFFVTSTFDFRDRYVLDLLVRQDGNSRFGPDSRRKWYYRGSGAYRISEEGWFNIPAVDELKLRYSIGTAGNTPRWEAQYETYSVSAGSIAPLTLGNRDLRPEYATEQEVGIEAVFGGRYSLELNYAHSRIEDQVLQVPLLALEGFATQWQNAGTLTSRTFEATLAAQAIRTDNFTWNTRLMFDRTRQEITELNVPAYRMGIPALQNLGNVFRVREGEVLGTFYGFQFAQNCGHLPAGVDCSQFQVNDDGYLVWVGGAGSWQNGWQTYTDEDGNQQTWWGTQAPVTIRGTPIMWGSPFQGEGNDPLTGERTTFLPLGNTQPDFRIGFANTFTWRGFSLYGLLETLQGFSVYNQPLQWALLQNYSGLADQAGVPEEAMKPLGYYQAIYQSSGLQPSSSFVTDASFTKLREVSLRYRATRSVLDRLPIASAFDGATFSLTGRNLLTWSKYDGYDPDVGQAGGNVGSAGLARVDGFGYPPFRTLTLGIELNF